MRIPTVGLLFVVANLLGACVRETSVFHSPDGKNYFREGDAAGPAPAIAPAAPPPAQPVPSR